MGREFDFLRRHQTLSTTYQFVSLGSERKDPFLDPESRGAARARWLTEQSAKGHVEVALGFDDEAVLQHLVLVVLVPGSWHRFQPCDLRLVLELQGIEAAMA